MKPLFALLVFSLIPIAAVAGPEDHMYETCYTATTSTHPSQIPSTFCFDGMILNDEKTLLTIWGTFSNLPDQMKVSSSIYKTEDRVKFTAKNKIVNIWESGCGDGLEADLTISGESDITQGEQINPKELKIKIDYLQTNDTCHSQPQDALVEYKLIVK